MPAQPKVGSVLAGYIRELGGIMKTKITALVIAAAITSLPTYASAQVCGIGIIATAFVANFKYNRELTSKEAQTCGLLLGQDKANEKPAKAKKNPKPS